MVRGRKKSPRLKIPVHGVKTTRKPLRIPNKFGSIGVTQKANHTFFGPISRDAMSSAEHEMRDRAQQNPKQQALSKLASLGLPANEALMSRMNVPGKSPYSDGFDMSQFMTSETAAMLPNEGVTRADVAEQKLAIARQVEQYNAGILTPELYKKRELLKYLSQKKADEMKGKIVQYLATNKELIDPLPASLQEEVDEYYRAHPEVKVNEIQTARDDYKKKKEKEAAEKRQAAAFFYNPNPFSGLTFKPGPGIRYSDAPVGVDAPSSYSTQNNLSSSRIPNTSLRLYNSGNNPNNIDGSGWRASPLHRLVRPFKKFEIPPPPDKIIEGQKEEKEEWKEQYKEDQQYQRGIPPPKDMVERAYPKYAKPAFLPGRTIPNTGIVPHDFLFPRKKYWVRHGLY